METQHLLGKHECEEFVHSSVRSEGQRVGPGTRTQAGDPPGEWACIQVSPRPGSRAHAALSHRLGVNSGQTRSWQLEVCVYLRQVLAKGHKRFCAGTQALPRWAATLLTRFCHYWEDTRPPWLKEHGLCQRRGGSSGGHGPSVPRPRRAPVPGTGSLPPKSGNVSRRPVLTLCTGDCVELHDARDAGWGFHPPRAGVTPEARGGEHRPPSGHGVKGSRGRSRTSSSGPVRLTRAR